MFIYRKYNIKNSDQFVASEFVEMQTSIQQISKELPIGSADHATDMILSFVKDHAINLQQVKDYPELASRISSKALPLQAMEELFEASRQNPLFRKQMEDYIRSCLSNYRLRL